MTLLIDQLHNAGTNMLLYTIIGFAIISYALYKFVLRQPTNNTQQQQQRTAAANNNARSNNIQTNNRTSTSTSTTASIKSNNTNNDDEDDYTFGKSRHPNHMLPPKPNNAPLGSSNKAIDLSGCLLNGIIPFRSTFASGYETKLQQQQQQSQTDNDVIVNNRRERARIFARMFSSPTTKAGNKKPTPSSNKPPNRGANIVITVHHSDITTINERCYCTKLQKVLYLLGTYYNLFLLVHLDDEEEEEKKKIGSGNIANGGEGVNYHTKKLRTTLLNNNNQQQHEEEEGGYILNEQIIPPHRIIVTSTTKSRVAFVRQLNGTELVMDYEEEEVTKELERFGFRVLCYPREKEGRGEGGESGGGSALGKFLIP